MQAIMCAEGRWFQRDHALYCRFATIGNQVNNLAGDLLQEG